MESTKKELPYRIEWRNQNGQRHREDGPAIELSDGDNYWFFERCTIF